MSYAKKIRELLQANPDGMTVRELTAILGCQESYTRYVLHDMHEVYVDRWTQADSCNLVQVFCLVEVPADAPRPEPRSEKGKARAARRWEAA